MCFSPCLYSTRSKEVSGIVTSVYSSGKKDLVFKIAGLNLSFCISHGLQKNFSLQGLREKVLGKKVRIEYADRWNPLDPGAQKNIACIKLNETVVFSESDH